MATTKRLKSDFAVEKKNKVFFTGHQLQATNDAEHIFCQCSSAVNIVELNTGNIVTSIESEEDVVTSICLTPNSASLAIGYQSSTLKHYNVENVSNPRLLSSFKSYHKGPVSTLCWDASSTMLATGSTDGTARVWDLKQKFCTHSLKGAKGVFKVLMFDTNLIDRQWIFGAVDDKIYIWQLLSGSSSLVSCLKAHSSAITGLQMTQDRTKLISCGLDKVIVLWDLVKLAKIKVVPVMDSLSGIIVKPKDLTQFDLVEENRKDWVFTIGNKGNLSIWDPEENKECWRSDRCIIQPNDNEISLINHISYLPSKDTIMLATYDHSIVFFNVKTKTIWKQWSGYNDDIVDVIFLGENDAYLAVATNSLLIRIYDNQNLNCKFIPGHKANVLGLSRHPEINSIFASCSHDCTAKIWKCTKEGSADCIGTALGHTQSVGSIVLTLDFLITGSKDTCIKIWPIDSKSLISGQELKLYSTRTQKAHDKDINSLAVSKNQFYIATASQDKKAKIWSLQSLDMLDELRGHKKSIWCVRFSPSDRIVATASADATIRIWTLDSFVNVSILEGHDASVLSMTWISNGLQLLSTASDGLIKIWTIKDRLCVNTFDEHDDRLWALAVSEDGNQMVSAGSDSNIVWWKDITEEQRIKKHEEEKKLMEEEQKLMNLIQDKKWKKALRFALRLNQPYRALMTMKNLLDENPSELGFVLDQLKDSEISSLLEFVIQWNTKTKNVREAQMVLNYLLKTRLTEEMESLPDWPSILEGSLPYTERHLKRLAALRQSSSILNYFVSVTSSQPLHDSKYDVNTTDEDRQLLMGIPNLKLNDDEIDVDSGDSIDVQSDDDIMMPLPIED